MKEFEKINYQDKTLIINRPVHNNNFNLLRFLFANAVIFSHSFALLGVLTEPFSLSRYLGYLSVHGFFVISGYLITQSYISDTKIILFCIKRFLRIVPALIVAVVMAKIIAGYCGQFKDNPIPYIQIGPVWTLSYEALCYFGVAILGVFGALNKSSFPGFFAAACLIYILNIFSNSTVFTVLAPMMFMFLSGAFIFVMENKNNNKKFPILIFVFFILLIATKEFIHIINWFGFMPFLWASALAPKFIYHIVYMVVFPLVVIYIGKHMKPLLKIKNDISYGLYIYAWPIAQAIVYIANKHQYKLSQPVYFLITYLLVVPVAFLSWKIIEKPALSLKKFIVFRKNKKQKGGVYEFV